MRRISMRLTALLLSAALAVSAAADMRLTVEQLTAFIRSSVSMKHPDKQVAEYLKHVKLVNKLDDRTIEELQGLGAGPKTVAALHDLRDETTALPAAPPPPPKPVVTPLPGPDSIEQAKILDEVREYALNYSKQLPNFICLQVTRRFVDQRGGDDWVSRDTFTARLSYFEHRENYKVVFVNNRAVTTDMPMERLGGTISAGEFGSMMEEIFLRDSEARFAWDHWATLRGKRVMVFSYDIDQAHSKYHIKVEGAEEIVPAYRGLLYVDQDNHMVTRITLVPYDLPAGYPVQNVKSVLDYDYQKIGDNEYLLPMKVTLTSRLPRYTSKNEVEFRLYQKFGTETSIKFETPEPLPEDKTKEKPIKP
jgi:hypothetical protein